MATEEQWKQYTEDKFEGKLSGNAVHARIVKKTPLTSAAILDLVWNNMEYAGDLYYRPLWAPVEMRVEEYYEQLKGKK